MSQRALERHCGRHHTHKNKRARQTHVYDDRMRTAGTHKRAPRKRHAIGVPLTPIAELAAARSGAASRFIARGAAVHRVPISSSHSEFHDEPAHAVSLCLW
jgi:hypothetical protein